MDGFEVVGLRLDLMVTAWVAAGLFVIAALLGWAFVVAKKKKTSSYDDSDFGWFLGMVLTGVCALITSVALAISFVPYQSLYHHWYSAAGTVESVTNIFEGGSGEISPGYVVELDSVDQPLLFDDPRILRMAGEEINVTCSVAWVPSGVDRLNCWIAK